jgi:hypothetical protein
MVSSRLNPELKLVFDLKDDAIAQEHPSGLPRYTENVNFKGHPPRGFQDGREILLQVHSACRIYACLTIKLQGFP